MPQLLQEGLPQRGSRSKFDFQSWADGQAWKFVKGEDYNSSTETFRYNIRRWAREHGFEADLRPFPAVDRDGNEVALSKTDAVALGVILRPAEDGDPNAGAGAGTGTPSRVTGAGPPR